MNFRERMAEQIARVNTSPTEGQKSAGNYSKGHVRLHGLPISIENPKGSYRHGLNPNGTPWKCKVPASYGYIKGTEGSDGDHVDVYIGPHHRSPLVYVIDQKDADTGRYDEHKCMLGFASPKHARNVYLSAFSDGKGQKRLGAITEMTVAQFKKWLAEGDTRKPLHRAAGGSVWSDEDEALRQINERAAADNEKPWYSRAASGVADAAKRFADYDREFTENVMSVPGAIKRGVTGEDGGTMRKGFNRLVGRGEEREQTWPEKMVRSGSTLPGDVASGAEPMWQYDPTTGEMRTAPKAIERAQDTAGMAMGSSFAAPAGEASLRSGASALRKSPDFFDSNQIASPKNWMIENADALKEVAQTKRNRGQHTGKMAEGWEFKRPEAEKGSWDDLRARTDARWEADKGRAQDIYREAVPGAFLEKSEFMKPDYWNNFYSDSGKPGAAASALAKQAQPFYSAVEHAVEAIPQATMRGDQWLGTLKNKPGVKPEEMDWIGLTDYLGERRGQPVTKQEISDVIAGNKVELQDVRKGGGASNEQAFELAKEHGWKSWDEMDAATQHKYLRRAQQELGNASPTKYHDYQLPGGENYREMLLTLPGDKRPYGTRAYDEANRLSHEMHRKYGNGWRGKATPDEVKAIDDLEARGEMKNPDYRSSHWDEPNILAHVRMNDRAIDGKRSLHLEEIQSDFMQDYRKQKIAINKAIDADFDSIAAKMLEDGVIKKVCD